MQYNLEYQMLVSLNRPAPAEKSAPARVASIFNLTVHKLWHNRLKIAFNQQSKLR